MFELSAACILRFSAGPAAVRIARGGIVSLVMMAWVGGLSSGQENRTIRGPLRVHPDNGRYFTDGSRAEDGSLRVICLAGSHTWHVLQDQGTTNPPRPFDYAGFLALLKANHHNFFRMWAWEHSRWACWTKTDDFWYSPMPYVRVAGHGAAQDGLPKYDLTKFNQEYFLRLRQRVEMARKEGIYVAVMFFQGVSVEFKKPQYKLPWNSHPFHKANNINGIDGDTNGDGHGYDVHEWPLAKGVWELQQAYIRKVIDTVNDLDNVLYEVANECHPKSTAWQYQVIRFIKEYEKSNPRQHPVGMTAEYPEGGTKDLHDSPADWISPSGADWDFASPPLATGKKVVLADTDHLPGTQGDRQFVWKAFTRGNMPILMDEPAKNDAERIGARQAMGHTLGYASRMNLAAMTPTEDKDQCSTGYCLRNPGVEYLVYQPENGPVTVRLQQGRYEVEWFDAVKGRVAQTSTQDFPPGAQTLNPPGIGSWVVYLRCRPSAEKRPQ